MMAGQFEGQWYRAIIDEVNLKCQDVNRLSKTTPPFLFLSLSIPH